MGIARSSLYGIASALAPLTVSIITIPLYIERIGAARYGALSIAWLLLAYFGQADFGIGRSVTQRISSKVRDDPGNLATVVWSALAMIGGMSAILAGIVYLVAHWYFSGPFEVSADLRGEMVESVWLLALCAPVVAMSGVFWGVLAGLERFALISIGNFTSTLALQVVPLLVATAFGPHLAYLVLASLASRMLMLLILGTGAWYWTLRGQPVRANVSEARNIGGFGVWVMIASLAGPLMIYTDRLVIGWMIGAAAVAAYAIPAIITARIQIIPNMIGQTLFPRFAAEDPEASRARCRDYIVFMGQSFAIVVIGMICFTAPLLEAWLGPQLDPRSIEVGQIIMAGWWCNSMGQVAYAYLQARGYPRFTAMLNLAEMPLYFAALLASGTLWGLTGIVAASALRCVCDAAALLWRAGMVDRSLLWRLFLPAALILTALALTPWLHGWLRPFAAATALCSGALIVLLVQMPADLRASLLGWPVVRGLVRFVPGRRLDSGDATI
jgi:O-antigen/teichoic acid export membrane protein